MFLSKLSQKLSNQSLQNLQQIFLAYYSGKFQLPVHIRHRNTAEYGQYGRISVILVFEMVVVARRGKWEAWSLVDQIT